ncbi:UNVERIFIED_CONTAM: Heparanase-like protein 1 [Sesamum calycinum]|uniref:Heparanase-like protein 1 n=1 Tax=Sesamum calycinum TaxID=2727403 RepID=A0AAW2NJ65_9LAMI
MDFIMAIMSIIIVSSRTIRSSMFGHGAAVAVQTWASKLKLNTWPLFLPTTAASHNCCSAITTEASNSVGVSGHRSWPQVDDPPSTFGTFNALLLRVHPSSRKTAYASQVDASLIMILLLSPGNRHSSIVLLRIGIGLTIAINGECVISEKSEEATLVVDTSTTVAETDVNYICATIDWWPQDKCNYNRCPWGSSSVINLDLSHPFLGNAIQAFKNLRIRVGGSLQDQVLYDVGNSTSPCNSFRKEKGGLFGFSKGCLSMKRWDDLNNFFKKTGVLLTFGLNALNGRQHIRKGVWGGDWDSRNARDFIRYTISKGYHIDSWEFGNELCGKGIGASVGAEQYGKDSTRLNAMIAEMYGNSLPRSPLLAPGGFYDKLWFDKLLQVSGAGVVNTVSHHMYTLGPGNDLNIMNKILNPDHLNKASYLFSNVTTTIQANGPWASAWVSESGGPTTMVLRIYLTRLLTASGLNHLCLKFRYLDQLGMAATYDTKVYCRQTLIGGFYGLLNQTTFVPNPDYYSALLWHRLMGKGVLTVKSHPVFTLLCSLWEERAGITLLLINLSNETAYNVEVQSRNNAELSLKDRTGTKRNSFVHGLKRSVSWIGNKASDENLSREEYHLTPVNGDLQSKIMLLNGNRLQVTETGDIPSLVPVLRDVNSPLSIAPYSIKFVVFPSFSSPGCQ